MQQDHQTVRRLFIEEFIARVIDACTPNEMRPLIEKQIHSPLRVTPKVIKTMSVDDQVKALERTLIPFAAPIEDDLEKITKFNPVIQSKPIPRPLIQRRPISQIISPIVPKPQMKSNYSAMVNMQAEKPILIGGDFGFQDSEKMKYVLFLLTDPTVQSVECPGLGKQVLLNKSGNIIASNISLSREEIDGIMQAISKKTKVPIIPGLFKAAFDNFLVTAVISELAGTRFVIQKVYHPPSPPIPQPR